MNGPQLFPGRLERYERYRDMFVEKGDFGAARQITHQLAALNVSRFSSLPDELAGLAARHNERLLKTIEGPARKFDFFVLPSLRGGSRIMELLFHLHPAVIAPPMPTIDEAILSDAPAALLHRYRSLLTSAYPLPKKVGFVFHRFLFSPGEAQRAAETASILFDTPRFLQIVRDPESALLSEFNHHFISAYRGDYSFRQLGLAWPDRNVTPLELPSPPTEELDAFFDHLVPSRLIYQTLGDIFRRRFPDMSVMAFESLLPSQGGAGIRELCRFAEVDPSADDPLLNETATNVVGMLMEKNAMPITIGAYRLQLALGYADQTALHPNWKRIELAWCAPSPEAITLGLEPRTLCLTASAEAWAGLPHSLQFELLQKKTFDRILTDVLLPNWLNNFAAWQHNVSPFLRREISSRMRDSILRHAGEEIRGFLAAHPAFAERWPIAARL